MVLPRFLYNFGKFAFFAPHSPAAAENRPFSLQKRKSAIDHNGLSRIFGAPAGTRILDPLIKSQMLYQLSYEHTCLCCVPTALIL